MNHTTVDTHSLILQLSYHGFSYHGWVMQKNLPSIEGIFRQSWEKTFSYPVRAFAVSRTDAHVHALDQWIKVMAKKEIIFSNEHMHQLNAHLPADIRVLSFKSIPKGFNIIGAAKKKEYCYLFANALPTQIPLVEEKILHFAEPLDMDLMQKAAACFMGIHHFYNFQRREKPSANFMREVVQSSVTQISHWQGYDFDHKVFCYSVEAKGFLRQMVRIMVGAILNVGQGRCTLEDLKASLKGDTKNHVGFVSPGYGLYLKKVTF